MFLVEVDLHLLRDQAVLELAQPGLAEHARAPGPEFPVLVEGHHVVAPAAELNYVAFDDLGDLLVVEGPQAELATVVVLATAAPGVEVPVLAECGAVEVAAAYERDVLRESGDAGWLFVALAEFLVPGATPGIDLAGISEAEGVVVSGGHLRDEEASHGYDGEEFGVDVLVCVFEAQLAWNSNLKKNHAGQSRRRKAGRRW